MGAQLFDEVAEFRRVERDADRLLGYSLRELCLADSQNRLKQTEYTQPALYTVCALSYYKAIAFGERPDLLAGHSLGEYAALLAAGAYDFITGLRIVQKRGALMAQVRNGGMAAVVGLSPDSVTRVLREGGFCAVDTANFNSPQQAVISGPVEDIKRAAAAFERAGAQLYAPLPVSGAFHSRYMAPMAAEFRNFLSGIEFQPLQLPVISNVAAQPYPTDSPSTEIPSLLVRQCTQPVLWAQSIQYLAARGASAFREIGPGSVLTNLARQMQRKTV
jgi:malonyl CoA-acyl carrier protein transacylase